MRNAKEYITLNGWKIDLAETLIDIKDLATLIRRTIKPSNNFYENLTSRENKRLIENATSLIFNSEKEFQLYALTNKWPLGSCVIYEGKNRRRFDDSAMFA